MKYCEEPFAIGYQCPDWLDHLRLERQFTIQTATFQGPCDPRFKYNVRKVKVEQLRDMAAAVPFGLICTSSLLIESRSQLSPYF